MMISTHNITLHMFLKSPADQPGFWEQFSPSATINWCESDYTVSSYIAEFQNTVSSLSIMMGGLIGFYWAYKLNHPRSLRVFTLLVAMVGLGSAIFHATLLYYPQMLDELPMLFAIVSFINVFCGVAKEISSLRDVNGQHLKDPYHYLTIFSATKPFYYLSHALAHVPIVGWLLNIHIVYNLTAFLLIISTIHVLYGFVVIFQLTFGVITAMCLSMIIETRFLYEENEITHKYKRWTYYYVLSAVVALVCWLCDNFFCSALLTSPIYISFHGLWHNFNYLSTYSGIILAAYAQQMAQNAKVSLPVTKVDIPADHAATPSLISGPVVERELTSSILITPITPFIGVENLPPGTTYHKLQ